MYFFQAFLSRGGFETSVEGSGRGSPLGVEARDWSEDVGDEDVWGEGGTGT